MNRKAVRQVKRDYQAYCDLCAKSLGIAKSALHKQQIEASHRTRFHGVKAEHVADATYSHAAYDAKHRHNHIPISRIGARKKSGWSF